MSLTSLSRLRILSVVTRKHYRENRRKKRNDSNQTKRVIASPPAQIGLHLAKSNTVLLLRSRCREGPYNTHASLRMDQLRHALPSQGGCAAEERLHQELQEALLEEEDLGLVVLGAVLRLARFVPLELLALALRALHVLEEEVLLVIVLALVLVVSRIATHSAQELTQFVTLPAHDLLPQKIRFPAQKISSAKIRNLRAVDHDLLHVREQEVRFARNQGSSSQITSKALTTAWSLATAIYLLVLVELLFQLVLESPPLLRRVQLAVHNHLDVVP
jgi:hypothetical protein